MNKIDETLTLLKDLGLPKAQQNERSALTLLALLNLREKSSWQKSEKRTIRIHDIMVFIQEHYKKHYAENTRETIRRQTIHQFEQAGIVIRNSDNPIRPTNSPNTVYSISDDALEVIRKYQTRSYKAALNKFSGKKGKLIERYNERKRENLMHVELPYGKKLNLSPGKHNALQVKIIEEFRKRFCPRTIVVYVGNTERKLLHLDENLLKKLKIPITKNDKLPDVVLYDAKKDILILIEAVTAHGPLSSKRQIELEEELKNCKSKRIYVSAFPDFREFKKHIDNVAWETEVWIENNPDHMVHFNGPKFFTIYNE